jgi:parallel beta-helix repeat protein
MPSYLKRVPAAAAVVAGAFSLIAAGCGSSGSNSTSTPTAGRAATLRVPKDAPTVQAAVDQSKPGDLVLIAKGIYREAVMVRTPRLTIRGEDRNGVILDGDFSLSDGIVVATDGVSVENLTLRNYLNNGLIFNGILTPEGTADPARKPIDGWRGRYVTAINNGLYGVYAFSAQNGVFDHVYASGSGDSGIYIGQCHPCNALVTDSAAVANTIGYEGTNSGGDVVLVRSTYNRNRIGIAINSSHMERAVASSDVVVAGNIVDDNDNPVTPEGDGAFGFGIAIGGAENVTITKNRVRGNLAVGIVITEQETFVPGNNRVTGNVLSDNGIDLGLFPTLLPTLPAGANCFAANRFGSSFPPAIETAARCDSGAGPQVAKRPRFAPQPPGVTMNEIPHPPRQPSMPGAAEQPASPAIGLPPTIDLNRIGVPT